MGVRVPPGARFDDIMLATASPKIALISLGCSKNTVDSEKLLGRMFTCQFDIVANAEEADAVIINTCGFIQPAIEETRNTIYEIIGLKKIRPGLKVYAMGCYVSRGKEDLLKSFPGLDNVFPLSKTDEIIPEIQADLKFKKNPDNEALFVDQYKRPLATTLPHLSYLKISEGCQRTCTYCTIPSIRGNNRSKLIPELVQEATFLSQRGVKELILIAQDTTAYGIDNYGEPRLLPLLKELVKIREIKWLRLLYAYPDYFTDDLLSFFLNEPKLVPYLDMPVQHTHPSVLKRMCRSETQGIYDDVFRKLRSGNKDFALRTTLITGFPGETEEEFLHSSQYIRRTKFDRLGVFKYIREDKTPSDKLPGHLSEDVKQARYEELMLIQQKIHFKLNKAWVGRALDCIIDSVSRPGVFIGRTFRDAPEIDSLIVIHSKKQLIPGDIVKVHVTESNHYDLKGKV